MIASRLEAERGLLGAVLLSGDLLTTLLVEEHLTPVQFTVTHRRMFAGMVALHDADRPVDEVTLLGQLEHAHPGVDPVALRGEVAELQMGVPALGAWREYAAIVRREAEWERRGNVLMELGDAIHSRDDARFELAELKLQVEDHRDTSTADPEMLGHQAVDYLMGVGGALIPTQFDGLNRLLSGGLRPGDVTLVAGWTSMGKSLWGDALLRFVAQNGFTAHAYINEMSKVDRALRTISAMTRVPLGRLRSRQLVGQDSAKAMDAASRMPFGITECAGWPVGEITRHIRRHRWDVCLVDGFNLIPGAEKTETADQISGLLNNAARQAGTHLVLVAQLNQERNKTMIRPVPVLRDLRTTGRLGYDAENVLFVHRVDKEVEDADGDGMGYAEPSTDGVLVVAKARSASIGAVPMFLNTGSLTFHELDRPSFEAAVQPAGRMAA